MSATRRHPRPSFSLSPRASEKTGFLAKVYGLLTLSLTLSAVTVAAACLTGHNVAFQGKTLPATIVTALEHPYLMTFGFLGLVFLTAVLRRVQGINVVGLGVLSVVSGLFISPAIYMAQMKAHAGATFSPQPVLHAFVLAAGAFVVLSLYALVSGRDFSSWAGFLYVGLWVLIGAGILNLFLGGALFALALSSVSVVLFSGFILYDTSRMLEEGEDDAVGCALSLYLDFLNLFLNLVRLLSGSSKD